MVSAKPEEKKGKAGDFTVLILLFEYCTFMKPLIVFIIYLFLN